MIDLKACDLQSNEIFEINFAKTEKENYKVE